MKLINILSDHPPTAPSPAKPPQRKPVDLARYTLELTATLARHLELETLIDHFSRRIGEILPHDSLSFRHELAGHWHAIAHGSGGRHSCTYQLQVEDTPLGTLRIARRQRFEEPELAMLEQLLGVIVYPLRNALLYRRAQHDAATDPLTGLSNRGVFDDALPREVSRAQRYGTSLTLLVVDLDNLKHINDRAGHSAGDRALQQVAGMLRAGVRDSDQVFRYAGDEFAVLLVGGDATSAREVAERLRSRVAELPADAGPARPTLSIGLAPLRAADSGQALFERADSALYGAKQAGRNCVCSAD
jgi:diguanylate cyclase (GGDEF)-like protein